MAEGKHASTVRASTQKSPISSANSSATVAAADGSKFSAKISTLFFDLDNTLIPTRAGDSKALRKLAEVLENQFAFSKEDSTAASQTFLKAFRRCPDNSQTSLVSWRTYLWREALPARYKHLAEQIYPKWLQLRYRYMALAPEHVHMLRRFREAGYLLALITNGPSNAQWEKIKKLNVSQYFDCVLVSSDLPWEKPNPQIFYAACNFLRVKPIECIMIGDKLETDIKGGRLAGLGATFWLPLNPAHLADLTDVTHPPDIILRQLVDLYKYFPRLNAAVVNGSGSGIVNGASSSAAARTAALASTMAAATSGGAPTRRRGSQINCSATPSTCESDLLHHGRHQQRQYQQRHLASHSQGQGYICSSTTIGTGIISSNSTIASKYRRGGSLPAIECFNSEAENSSDSVMS